MNDQQQRITLTNSASRCLEMRRHVESITAAILQHEPEADMIIQRALDFRRMVHGYSFRNRLLQQWQAPMSRLVTSLSAFDRMAAEQGAEGISIKGRRTRVMIRAGARAVWIWGRHTQRREFNDDLTGDPRDEVHVSYIPVSTWAVEDITYAASGEPFALPDFIAPVDDERLFKALLAFAAHKGIRVEERGLHGPRGLSSGGLVTLQAGDDSSVQCPILCHELAHEILHQRPGAERLPRGLAEAEAEICGAAILRAFSHPTPMSAAYCRNWGMKPADLLQSLDRVARAAGEIVAFVSDWRGDQ